MKKSNKVDLRGWENAFYIVNLSDGSHFYHIGKCDTDWFQLRIKPHKNPNHAYYRCRHNTLGAGPDYDTMLRLLSKYVSLYDTPEDMFEYLLTSPNGCVVGKPTLALYDEYWETFSEDSVITRYNKDIVSAIKLGMNTKTYAGYNVKVTYTEETDECSITGIQHEWYLDFIDRVMSFNGKTKQEFYDLLSDDCDIDGVNQIFANLKDIGCNGIKDMKQLNMYRWLDVLTPLVNEWDFYSDGDETEDYDE